MNIIKRNLNFSKSLNVELEIFVNKDSSFWKDLKKSKIFSGYSEEDIIIDFAMSFYYDEGPFSFNNEEDFLNINFLKKTSTMWGNLIDEDEEEDTYNFKLSEEIDLSDKEQKFYFLKNRLYNEKIYGHFYNKDDRKNKVSTYLHKVNYLNDDKILYYIDKDTFFECFEEIDPNQMELDLGD